jgi:hypothetical protein
MMGSSERISRKAQNICGVLMCGTFHKPIACFIPAYLSLLLQRTGCIGILVFFSLLRLEAFFVHCSEGQFLQGIALVTLGYLYNRGGKLPIFFDTRFVAMSDELYVL